MSLGVFIPKTGVRMSADYKLEGLDGPQAIQGFHVGRL
jgi:hypothetical protein